MCVYNLSVYVCVFIFDERKISSGFFFIRIKLKLNYSHAPRSWPYRRLNKNSVPYFWCTVHNIKIWSRVVWILCWKGYKLKCSLSHPLSLSILIWFEVILDQICFLFITGLCYWMYINRIYSGIWLCMLTFFSHCRWNIYVYIYNTQIFVWRERMEIYMVQK